MLAALYARKRLSMRSWPTWPRWTAPPSPAPWTACRRPAGSRGWPTPRTCAITRLALTAAGEQLFDRIWPVRGAPQPRRLEGLPDGAVEMLAWTLKQMKANLERGLAANEDVA